MLPPINRDAFFSAYRATFGKLKQPQVDGLSALLAFFEADELLSDIRHAAYMLATVRHECAGTWQPITERGLKSYFDKYEAGTKIGARLGNALAGDGYFYRGRGYVQITGRSNYARMARATSVEYLASSPELALLPKVAYDIMTIGMHRGLFTGKRLADYIEGEQCDYRNARRIINGLDRADLIASYARDFEKILKGAAAFVQEVGRG